MHEIRIVKLFNVILRSNYFTKNWKSCLLY